MKCVSRIPSFGLGKSAIWSLLRVRLRLVRCSQVAVDRLAAAQRNGPSGSEGPFAAVFGGLVSAAPAALLGPAVVAAAVGLRAVRLAGKSGERLAPGEPRLRRGHIGAALFGATVVAHAGRLLDRIGVECRWRRALRERRG